MSPAAGSGGELLHVLDDPVRQAMRDLAAHVGDEARRRRALRRAERAYEAWHDGMAHRLAGLL